MPALVNLFFIKLFDFFHSLLNFFSLEVFKIFKAFLLMKKLKILLLSFIFLAGSYPRQSFNKTTTLHSKKMQALISYTFYSEDFYHELQDSTLNFSAFQLGLKGYFNLKSDTLLHNDSLLSIIDYSLPSSRPRFYLISIPERKIVLKTFVSHGKNSGEDMALSFSNEPNSFKSSMGFFLTAETYSGKHGLSMRVDGLEPNINSNARKRDIVIHGADYACDASIKELGFLGRSQGCPALPKDQHENIIEKIKECSCLFIYGSDKNYLNNSSVLKTNQYMQYFERD
jgi:hypothetical protein